MTKILRLACTLVALLLWCAPFQTDAAERMVVVNFTTAELIVVDSGAIVLTTPVVLPKGDYYPVPVWGVVQSAVMGPTWVPTENMHRDRPGKYRSRYGPYEQGNAMGHCKVSIDFAHGPPIMQYVRIHGNARPVDLGEKLSRSCIRIPDEICPDLVELAHAGARVYFIR